jgi:PTH1 family peptidyl-tRNA hydrolase
MWLIVGLGNPGPKYSLTRHNIGFLAVDFFLKSLSDPQQWQTEHKAEVIKFKIEDTPVLLAKPQTFMNKSGESVVSLLNFYKIPLEQLIVVHDDIDQGFGGLRLQKNRGHGGHNGIRSISELLGTADYIRLKLGVGRPPHPEMQVADYVLGKFSSEEQNELSPFLNKAGDALESVLFDGLSKASTLFNSSAEKK